MRVFRAITSVSDRLNQMSIFHARPLIPHSRYSERSELLAVGLNDLLCKLISIYKYILENIFKIISEWVTWRCISKVTQVFSKTTSKIEIKLFWVNH